MIRLFKISATVLLFLSALSCKGPDKAELTSGEPKKPAEVILHDDNSQFQLMDLKKYSFYIQPEKSEPIAEYVRRIFHDSKDHLWFATNSLGVCRYDGERLVYFSTKDGLNGNQVTGIIEDQRGNIWFSTNGGVSMYDGNSFTNYTKKNGLSSNSVWSIFEDSRGIIWAGTVDGLCKFDPDTSVAFTRFDIKKADVSNPTPRFSTNLVSSIMEDKDGNLWFGTDGVGVYRYDPSTDKKDQLIHFTKKDGLCDNSIVHILQDKTGKIWFSSRFGGLSHFDGTTFTNLNRDNGDIGDNEVWTMHEDKAGNLWFSSEGFGIYRNDGNTIKNFGVAEGLPIRAVQSIYEDKQGLLWIGGGGGLYLFDGKQFTHVTQKDLRVGC